MPQQFEETRDDPYSQSSYVWVAILSSGAIFLVIGLTLKTQVTSGWQRLKGSLLA